MQQLLLFQVDKVAQLIPRVKQYLHNRFAVIDNRIKNVVWGVGETETEALLEAARYVTENTLSDYSSIKTNTDFLEAVEEGQFKIFKCSREFLYFIREHGGQVRIVIDSDVVYLEDPPFISKVNNCCKPLVKSNTQGWCPDALICYDDAIKPNRYYIKILHDFDCQCGRQKKRGMAFCWTCWQELFPSTQRDLYKKIGQGFEQAYEQAIKELK